MSGSKSSGNIKAPRQHFESCKPIAALHHALVSGWEMTLQQARPGSLIAIQRCGQSSFAVHMNLATPAQRRQHFRMLEYPHLQFNFKVAGCMAIPSQPTFLWLVRELSEKY